MKADQKTADAFANSWNNLPQGSVYTHDQFEDWLLPITKKDVKGKNILELGCGNGSLLVHMATWEPDYLEGVDLGGSVTAAQKNLKLTGFKNWKITQADLTEYTSEGYDLVYSIGVLHHLKEPKKGLDSVIANVKQGGRFHCWVYAKEGNALIICLVDPLRKIASKLPWWVTKYLLAAPLVVPYYFYAKLISWFDAVIPLKWLPLYEYSLWIAKREFAFFRHVAFDQLVTPQTAYISKVTILTWLDSYSNLDRDSIYLLMRNGNSWKFGGQLKLP